MHFLSGNISVIFRKHANAYSGRISLNASTDYSNIYFLPYVIKIKRNMQTSMKYPTDCPHRRDFINLPLTHAFT